MDALHSQQPKITAVSEHRIDRNHISPNALKVLSKLESGGYEAYLVGGAVRDLLLGHTPKDFDISTDAKPEQIRSLFRNSRIIGRRFKLVHVRYGREVIEVSTFRASHDEAEHKDHAVSADDGRILRDNVYGDIDSDVWRRDFTVNALYYNSSSETVVDYVSGVQDIEAGLLRMIGDPETRFREDPVRTIRALRFSAKLGFEVENDTFAAIGDSKQLLKTVSPARLFDEVVKLFHGGYALNVYHLLNQYKFFELFFPATDKLLQQQDFSKYTGFIESALSNTDKRISEDKPVTPAFLIAVMLWPVVQDKVKHDKSRKTHQYDKYQKAVHQVISEQINHLTMPRRFSQMAREIWILQLRFQQQKGRKPLNLLQHKRFRAAYDFLCLRAHSCNSDLIPLCDWWTQIQELDEKQRLDFVSVKESRKQKRQADTNQHREYQKKHSYKGT